MDIDALLKEIDTEDDWPEEALAFKQIEKSLSCAICHGPMKAAVLLSKCGHSFCSYCIRQYLITEQACPLCRKPATESDIVRNISVIEISDAFRENRKELLRLCTHLFSPRSQIMPSLDNHFSSSSSIIQNLLSKRDSQSSKRSSPSKIDSHDLSLPSSKEDVSIVDSDSDSDFEMFRFIR